MDDLLSKTSISKGTSNSGFSTGIDNEEVEENEKIDNDPIEEARPDGTEIMVILESNPIPTKLKDDRSSSEAADIVRWDDPGFTTYQPLPHMRNLDLAVDGGLGGLEFLDLPHKRPGHAFSSTILAI
ncbi:hypothetical protein GOBAR_DD01886 [Gossypium barbadense]|nr:hypothetical protein GOBAR_DD01886 [Gossypium barbadense]